LNSIVIELQNEALNKNVSVSDLLRKAYVVARKLGIPEFEKWTLNELNGYNDVKDIPEYRQIKGIVKAWNPFHGWQPVIFHDHKIEEALSKRPCGQAIAEIESLLSSKSKNGTLQMPFTAEAEQQLRRAIGYDTSITLIVPSISLVRIVDAVRTIILNWSLKLEEDGILGEGLSFTASEREKASKIAYSVNNFYGPVSNLQIQQGTAYSTQISSVQKFDINALREFVEEIKRKWNELVLAQEVKQELQAEIQTLEVQLASPKPKRSIIRKSLMSIRRILESAGGGLAAQLIMQKLIALLGG